MNWLDYASANRERICAWLRANGIEPGDVPMDARPRIVGDMIEIPVFSDPPRLAPDHTLVRHLISVPFVAEPGETVARWLIAAQPEGVDL